MSTLDEVVFWFHITWNIWLNLKAKMSSSDGRIQGRPAKHVQLSVRPVHRYTMQSVHVLIIDTMKEEGELKCCFIISSN